MLAGSNLGGNGARRLDCTVPMRQEQQGQGSLAPTPRIRYHLRCAGSNYSSSQMSDSPSEGTRDTNLRPSRLLGQKARCLMYKATK
jgi:hypothetical protein